MTNQNNTTGLENKIDCLKYLLVTPYNWSLILLSFISWLAISYIGYYNTNYDMLSCAANVIIATSLVSILIAFISKVEAGRALARLGVIALLLVFLGLISSKSVEPLLNVLGIFVIFPLSLFGFFVLLKNLWVLSYES